MKIALILLLFYGTFAVGSSSASSSNSEGEFHIDKNLVNELYKQTIDEERIETSVVLGSVIVKPQVSYATLSNFTLNNNYFEVHYTDSLKDLQIFYITVATSMAYFSRFDLYGQVRMG